MSRHRVDDGQPSHALIKSMVGVRHRLSEFYGPAADDAGLLVMYPSRGRVRDEGYVREVQRNLGVSAASQVLRDLFAEYDSYVLGLTGQRIVEVRPVLADDRLHSDVFVESHERRDAADSFDVRVVFTDSIGAMVFSCFLTFTGTLEPVAAQPTSPPERSTSDNNESSEIAISS